MDDLGLNTLTDDQLVELARGIAAEMANRNPAVVDATKAAIAAATARVTQDQDAIWTTKCWLARMVTAHLGAGWTLTVWRATGRDETRVYLETQGEDGRGRESLKYCLYVTGGSKFAPDTLTLELGSRASKKDHEIVKIICRTAVMHFVDGVRIECDYAAARQYNTPAEPRELQDRVTVLAAVAAHAAAREAYRREVYAREMEPITAAEQQVCEAKGLDSYFKLPMGDPDWVRINEARQVAQARIRTAMDLWDANNQEPK